MLELARAKVPDGHDIDGHSLVPLLSGKAGAHDAERPQWALSQGHMADNAISWFLLREGDMKLIVCKPDTLISSGHVCIADEKAFCADGTGKENLPQLFNITDADGDAKSLRSNGLEGAGALVPRGRMEIFE